MGSQLLIAWIWGHEALGAGMARCLVLPANHRATGPRVPHISRCPNMNPQGWPGLWPDAWHSLPTPSRPLEGCQVSAGTEGRRQKGRREKRACVKAARGVVPANVSKLAE